MTAATAGWWRRQWPWLLGAAVLATWAVVGPYLQDRQDYRLWNPSLPRAVATGAWGHYAGARWRLVEAHVVDATQLQDLSVRPDSQVVLLTFDVIADKGTRADALESCKSALEDSTGRRWDAEPLTLTRFDSKPYERSCGSRFGANFQREYALPGKPFRFQQIYQLPRNVPLAGLHVQLRLPVIEPLEPRGTYLQFTL